MLINFNDFFNPREFFIINRIRLTPYINKIIFPKVNCAFVYLLNQNKFNGAIKHFEKLLQKCDLGRDKAIVSFFIALCYQDLNIYNSAISYYTSTVNSYPTLDIAWSNLGMLYRKTGDYSKAIDCLEHSIKLNDKNPLAYNNLANLYISKLDADQAIIYANKALELTENLYQSTQVLALAYAIKGDTVNAEAYYKKCILQGSKNTKVIRKMIDELYTGNTASIKRA